MGISITASEPGWETVKWQSATRENQPAESNVTLSRDQRKGGGEGEIS